MFSRRDSGRQSSRRIVWITLFALVFHLLWPSIAQALPQQGATLWQEICSVDGTRKLIKTELGKKSEPAAQQGHDNHCPLCSGVGVLPTRNTDTQAFLLALREQVRVAPLAQAPVTPPLSRGPAPRAPPLSA